MSEVVEFESDSVKVVKKPIINTKWYKMMKKRIKRSLECVWGD